MGLFDKIKAANSGENPPDRIAAAKAGIEIAEAALKNEAAWPVDPEIINTPRGVRLLRLARDRRQMGERQKEEFLEALSRVPNEHLAALSAGVTVLEARKQKREDPDFAAAWELAAQVAVGIAEKEAFRRAIRGVKKTIYYQGSPVGAEREYSDTLMTKILAANEPRYEARSHVKATVDHNYNWFELVKALSSEKEETDK